MLDDQQRAFRDYVVALAKRSGPRYGVDWRLMAAAAILETGWGQSELAQNANNLFGIKATGSTPGDEVYLLGEERFRKYKSEDDAFRSYGWHMSQSRHYAGARQIARETALASFVENMAPVYCPPDPEYSAKIMRLVKMLDGSKMEGG